MNKCTQVHTNAHAITATMINTPLHHHHHPFPPPNKTTRAKTTAASTLWVLASASDANQQRIARIGAFSGLVQLLHSPTVDHRLHASGCLATLAANEANRHHIVDADAVPILVRLLRLKPLAVQEHCAHCLALVIRNNPKAQKQVVKTQGMETLTSLLDSNVADVKRVAAVVLVALSPTNKARLQAFKGGAVPPLLQHVGKVGGDVERALYAETVTQVGGEMRGGGGGDLGIVEFLMVFSNVGSF